MGIQERMIGSAVRQDVKEAGMGALAPSSQLLTLRPPASSIPSYKTLLSIDNPEEYSRRVKQSPGYRALMTPPKGGPSVGKGETRRSVAKKAKPASVTEELGKMVQDVTEKREKAREPHEKVIGEAFKQIQEAEKKMDEFLETYKKDVEERISGMEKAAGEELPKAPRIEAVERPKNLAQAVSTVFAPIVIGISAIFRGDRFGGYNYFYFNSMVDSLRKNDMEAYQKALQQWKIDYEYAKERKQTQLEVAKLQLQKLETTSRITTTQYEKQIKRYADIIKNEEKALEMIDKAADRMEKHLIEISKLELQELKLAEERRYHNIIAAKGGEGGGKGDLKLKENIFKAAKGVLDLSAKYTGSADFTREQVRNALMMALMNYGKSEQIDKETFEKWVDTFWGALQSAGKTPTQRTPTWLP